MGSLTNRGKLRILQSIFRRVDTPTAFYLALVTGATAPTAAINILSQLTDLPTGNGYTAGGQTVAKNSTDFDTLVDYPNTGFAQIDLKDFSWAASGGTIPTSGAEAAHLVLLDNNATPANRDVLGWWDYGFNEWAASGDSIKAYGRFLRAIDNYATSGWTSDGLRLLFDYFFRGATMPSNFYIGLVTNATAPTKATTVFSGLTEITAGNGYVTGGFQLTPNATDFNNLVENDTLDRAELQIKDVAWTASGGPIPLSGSGASYAVMLDDNVTIGSRVVYGWWNLGSARAATDGQQIILKDLELRLTAQAAMP